MNYEDWTTDELIEECYQLGILKNKGYGRQD
jgi:hypothetical protein